jgi:hypothetical protein
MAAIRSKKLLMLRPGISFSKWTLPSLPQPIRGAWSTPSNTIADLFEFRNIFLSKIQQIAVMEWPPFDQKRLLMLRPGIPLSTWTLPSLPQPIRGA